LLHRFLQFFSGTLVAEYLVSRRRFIMNQAYGWMGGGTLMWALLGILVVVVVVIKSLSRK
jgi:hypothetical protein